MSEHNDRKRKEGSDRSMTNMDGVGEAVGTVGGGAMGAVVGSALGPIGTIVGGIAGAALGNKAGEAVTDSDDADHEKD